MKITNIKQNYSFQNITRIESLTNPMYQNLQNRVVDKSSAEVEKVLNNVKSSIYSEKEARKIKDFFSTYISDYNSDKAKIVLIQNRLYLLTGKDFDEMKAVDELIKEATATIKKKLKNLLNFRAVSVIGNAKTKRDKQIIKRAEENPEHLEFLSSVPKQEITYDQAVGLEPISVKLDVFNHFA